LRPAAIVDGSISTEEMDRSSIVFIAGAGYYLLKTWKKIPSIHYSLTRQHNLQLQSPILYASTAVTCL